MTYPTMMKTRYDNGQTEVLVLVRHPMDTGLLKNKKTHAVIPAHYIRALTVSVNGAVALEMDMGIAISKDPLFGFKLTNAKPGDTIAIAWKDNLGDTGGATEKVAA